jgi:hypothetical protein
MMITLHFQKVGTKKSWHYLALTGYHIEYLQYDLGNWRPGLKDYFTSTFL